MAPVTRETVAVGENLPRLTLRRADGGGDVSVPQGISASVLVLPHPEGCKLCARYLEALPAEELRLWGTRLLAVAPAVPGTAKSPLVPLADDGTVRRRLGISAGDAAVLVADRYGAVYDVTVAGADHALPGPERLVELAQFIDIQCPECGVPDGEWRRACPFPLG